MTGLIDDTAAWEYESGPPSAGDVAAAREHALVAASQAEEAVVSVGSKRRKVVRDAASEAGRAAGAQVARRFGLVALLLALVVPWLVSGLAYSQSVATDRVVQSMAQRLDGLNVVLESRGQAPVSPAESDDPTAVAAAAVLAEVLTRLPRSPTAEDVAAELRDVVTANVLGPTVDEASVMVADYLRANPAPAGRPPSQAEIDAAVQRQYQADPPADGVDGDDGADGDDGQDGQDGADGAPGADGRSVLTGPEPVRLDDGTCVWRAEYDQAPEVVEYPAGDAACPNATPVEDDGDAPAQPTTSVMSPFLSLIGWSNR